MTNSLLKPKKVLKDTVMSLPRVYLPLLLINSPSVIFIYIFIPLIAGANPIVIYSLFIRLHLSQFLLIIDALLIFPYLQGASILYIDNYLKKVNCKILDTYKVAFKSFYRLILGHFIVLFRVSIITIIAFFGVTIIGSILAFTMPSIYKIFILVLAIGAFLMIIFYCSKLILIPHFIVIEKRGAGDSFVQTVQLTKDNEIRIFLFLLTGAILTFTLSRIAANFSAVARIITVFLCQPLFIVYSAIVYKHLKNNMD